MIVYLFQVILELFALNNVTLFLCWMWPAAEPLLRKGKHTHTNTHQELAQSKRGFCGLCVGTRAKAAEHGYGGRDLAVPGVGRDSLERFPFQGLPEGNALVLGSFQEVAQSSLSEARKRVSFY